MEGSYPTAILPAVTLLVAVMLYAGVRVFQSAYILVRDGLLQWQGRRTLGELQTEVDEGRRTSFELFLQHGMHHLQLRDPLRARAFFEAAALAHPLSPHGHYGQGLAQRESLYFAGRLQEEALEKALERDPQHDDARRLLIEFYLQAGLYEKARGVLGAEGGAGDWPSRAEPSGLGDVPGVWSRMSARERGLLVVLDLVLILAAVSAIFVPDVLFAEVCLLILIPYHLLLFWRVRADGDGMRFQSARSQFALPWTDLLDLVEAPNGGFFLHTADRSLYISRHWADYPDLLTRVKHHLYERGWVPALKEYGPERRIRPLLG